MNTSKYMAATIRAWFSGKENIMSIYEVRNKNTLNLEGFFPVIIAARVEETRRIARIE